jgi:hypothetical protein
MNKHEKRLMRTALGCLDNLAEEISSMKSGNRKRNLQDCLVDFYHLVNQDMVADLDFFVNEPEEKSYKQASQIAKILADLEKFSYLK